MFTSLSESALATFRLWVSWIAVCGSGVGVFCAILTILTTRETSRRAALRASEMETNLHATQSKLITAELDAKEARELAHKAHLAAQPRVLTPDQHAKLLSAFAAVPKGKVAVKASMLDSEAEMYAKQIKEALVAAGSSVIELPYTGIVAIHRQGGAVLVRDSRKPPQHAVAIHLALATIGLDFPVAESANAEFPEDTIIVWVSRK